MSIAFTISSVFHLFLFFGLELIFVFDSLTAIGKFIRMDNKSLFCMLLLRLS